MSETPKAPLGAATGYATTLYTVDGCLAWADIARTQFSGAYAFCATSQDERFLVLADEVLRLRGVIAACEEQHTADVEAIRALRNALRDASEEPNIDRARAIADAVLFGQSNGTRDLGE